MTRTIWKRSVSLVLALTLLLASPVTARAAEHRSTLIPLEEADVELDRAAFQYTGGEIRPNVTVRVRDNTLTLDRDYTLEYADNVEVGTGKVLVTGIATASETLGYTGTVEIPFQITKEPPAYTLVPLKGTDVAMEGTSFPYTGAPIEPAITVTVDGRTLTAGRDYSLTYRNNVEVGTATVTVSGMEEAGYTGQVNVYFTIEKDKEDPGYTLIELKGTDVTMEGTEFPYTSQAIEPEVTVTVEGKALVRDRDYTLTFENNTAPGTAYAVVRGIATASETVGYTGEVRFPFTIVESQAETKPAEPEATEPKPTEPEATLPDTTEPEATLPEATQPESDGSQSVTYRITRGNKATWYRQSGKPLSFTADGLFRDFEAVKIDGKTLAEKSYSVSSGSTVVTLKKEFLQSLSVGKHTIAIVFEDGEAEGYFRISEGLDETNPETGDAFAPGLWLTVMALSLAAGAGLFVFRKKIFD